MSCDAVARCSGLPGREFGAMLRGTWEPVDWMVGGLARALDEPARRVYLVCRLELVARVDFRWREALAEQEPLVIVGPLMEMARNEGLIEIHERKLWYQLFRRPYQSFEDYLQQRWGLDESRAFKLRQALWYSRPRWSPVVGNVGHSELEVRRLIGEQ